MKTVVSPIVSSREAAPHRLKTLQRVNLILLGVLVLVVSVLLWPQWLKNPDLSHGLFMPVIFALLIHEARASGPARYVRGPAMSFALLALLVAGIAGFGAGSMYAIATEWSHPLVGFTYASSLSLFLFAGIIAFANERVRLIPLNWNAMLAAGLWVLSAPIPPGTYMRLTLGLQLWVSEHVLNALHLLGIAANRQGNVIELATTSVGVEDACSGIRSLVSCVFAAFFFSGYLLRRPWPRAVLIAMAAPLAIFMNFLRSLALTLLANNQVDISGAWHDATGFAVLGVTAALLAGLAVILGRSRAAVPVAAPSDRVHVGPAPRHQQPMLCGALAVATLLIAFFGVHFRLTPESKVVAPNVEDLLPSTAAGWRVGPAQDLNRFRDALQTDHFAQRTYLRDTADGPVQITLYVAYWAPGQANVSLVATHTPDSCWPGVGWKPVFISDTREAIVVQGRALPIAEHRLFQNREYPQHVWFWHIYDGAPIKHLNPLSPRNVLKIATRYGFKRAGDQMFVRVSSNRALGDLANDPLLADFFARLQPHGL